MSHTIRDRKKLLNRIRRIRGQLEGIEKALEDEKDPFFVLQTAASCRGALNSLMAEIIEGHHPVSMCLIQSARQPPNRPRRARNSLTSFERFSSERGRAMKGHDIPHRHAWLVGIIGLIAGLAILLYVPSLKGVAGVFFLVAAVHVVGALVFFGSLYGLFARQLAGSGRA